MSSGIAPQCFRCSRLKPVEPGTGWVCSAFTDGIPKDILINQADHTKPYPGDNGLQFQTKSIVRAAGIMFIDPDGAVLLLRRSPNARDHAGEWSFPGGEIEDGETPEEAALREAIEEVGPYVYTDLSLWSRRIKDGVDFSTFVSRIPERFDPVLNEEHDSFQWVLPKEVVKDKLNDAKADSAKISKESALYTPHSTNPNEHCAICAMFQPPNGCTAVEDEVSPEGWCKLFEVRIIDFSRLDEALSLMDKF